MQRGSIEHEQIIYESSNRRMKQLVDWLLNSHSTPDTGMLTYLLSETALYWAGVVSVRLGASAEMR